MFEKSSISIKGVRSQTTFLLVKKIDGEEGVLFWGAFSVRFRTFVASRVRFSTAVYIPRTNLASNFTIFLKIYFERTIPIDILKTSIGF